MRKLFWFMAIVGCLAISSAYGAEGILPPGDTQPILRIEAGGPRSYVSAVVFSPQGDRLYATGWDKLVHVWTREVDGSFVYRPALAFRVPVGAGPYGGLNALSLSEDGRFLAVGGQGYARGVAGLKAGYWILPPSFMTTESQLDNGLIYVFDTLTRKVTLLRGHRGPVAALAFVRGHDEVSPKLVSAAEEYSQTGTGTEPRLRVWDVGSAAEVAQLSKAPKATGDGTEPLPPLQGWRPSLQSWTTGNGPKHVRVAIGWGDKRFRVWDVASDNLFQHEQIDNTLTVLPLSGLSAGRVLIGGHGKICEWNSASPLKPGQDFRDIKIPSLQPMHLVSAAALIPTANSPLAMFVVTKFGDQRAAAAAEYRLLVTSVSPDVKVLKEIPLSWRVGVRMPSVTASPDGQTVAVTGNERNEVEIYSVADLLADQKTPQQVLRGGGLQFREAAFVRHGDKFGLLFSEKPLPGVNLPPDALVFDISARAVQRNADGWKSASVRGTDWRVEVGQDNKVVVRGPGQPAIKLSLTNGETVSAVTSTAVCPSSKHCPVALVAVASHERGQPKLQLFRADTGEELRRCTAHTERIRAVSFSDDGRMLVSTADDRVTAVWSIVDIADRVLGKRGRLPGVSVRLREKDQAVVVVEAPPESNFARDDVILSAQRGKEEVLLASTADFYRFFLDRLPGDKVTVAVRRNEKVQEITTRVGQAIDDAKPLFSVFVANRLDEAGWSWIGWHPLGNFDASDEQAEQRLAWHFNTGEAEAPTRFAVIGEYRAEFYQRNLIAQLIADQGVRKQARAADPQLSLWIERSDGTSWGENYEGEALLRRADAHVVAVVEGIAESRIRSVDVRVADGEWQLLALRRDGKWTADLSKRDWLRGKHRIELRLRTAEAEPRELTQIQRVQYQPEPPQVEWSPKAPDAEVTQAELNLDAVVNAVSDAAHVELSIERPDADTAAVLQTWKDQRELNVKEKVTLSPGQNRLTLRAWNASAPDDAKAPETVKLVAVVQYKARPEAPRIEIQTVQAVSAEGATAPLIAEDGVFRTLEPNVRIKGRVAAKQALSKMTLRVGKDERVPDGFREDEAREFEFQEALTIKPGRNSVLLKASVADQIEEQRIDVFFAPKLPRFERLTLKEPELVQKLPETVRPEANRFYSAFHAAETVLQATLKGDLQHEYRARVLVGDEVVPPDQVSIDRTDEREHQLQARIKLPAGKGRIQVLLSNEWSSAPVSETLTTEFLRLPRITKIEGAKELEGEVLSLKCQIESLLPPQPARVSVDDQELPQRFPLEPVDEAAGLWQLKIAQLGLKQGPHTVRVQVENADGAALVAATHAVTVKAPAAPPPQIAIDSPGDNSSTHSAEVEARFSLQSEVPTVVTVRVRNHLGEETWSARREEEPGRHAALKWQVPLEHGPNEIELLAASTGGQARESIHVTLVRTPITVEIETVGESKVRKMPNGQLVFSPAVPTSRALLRGRVRFADPKQLHAAQVSARVWVNNFKLPTVPVTAEKTQPEAGYFETEVAFNLAQGNKIRVEVFRTEKQLASELGSTNEAIVDCLEPEKDQELHLLLIGVSEEEREQLMERARTTLQATRLQSDDSRETWKSAAFSRIYVDELFDRMTPHVQTRLRMLVNHVSQRQRRQTHPVVMIYYRGQVVLSDDNFALKTIDNWHLETINFRQSLNGKFMERTLSETNGAHLICLDLKQHAGAVEASNFWPKAPHLGVMVSNWRGNAEAPKEVRLISVLEKAMPQSARLRDVDARIKALYLAAEQQYPDQVESVQLLKNVHDLRLIGSADGS